MPLAGVGVDIVDIARMQKAMDRTPAFVRRVFTDEERAYCERRARPAEHYAARFAAREAVLKALSCGFSGGVGLRDVSVSLDEAGRPHAELTGRVAEIATDQDVLEVAISLSFTREVAVASAVAVTEEIRPKQKELFDPRRELDASFKEAKVLIDELERVSEEELEEIYGEVTDPEAEVVADLEAAGEEDESIDDVDITQESMVEE